MMVEHLGEPHNKKRVLLKLGPCFCKTRALFKYVVYDS